MPLGYAQIGAEPQDVRIPHGWAHFGLAPDSQRRRLRLIEHLFEAGRAYDDVREVLRLRIPQNVELPFAAPH